MDAHDGIVIVLALTTDTANYFFHDNYKEAVSPYRNLTGGDTFCRTGCNTDPACNGYSIDRTGC